MGLQTNHVSGNMISRLIKMQSCCIMLVRVFVSRIHIDQLSRENNEKIPSLIETFVPGGTRESRYYRNIGISYLLHFLHERN